MHKLTHFKEREIIEILLFFLWQYDTRLTGEKKNENQLLCDKNYPFTLYHLYFLSLQFYSHFGWRMTHLLRLHFAWRSLALSLYGMGDGLEKKILACYNWRGCRRSDGRISGSYQKCKLASWELRQTVEDIRYVIRNHSEE